MISHLRLKNFKAFEILDIELRPLTFILGQNNSGKSSIIAPFRLLIQTMESYDQQVALLLDGIMGDFGTYKDIVFGNYRARGFEISFDICTDTPKEKDIFRVDLAYKFRTKRRELILKKSQIFKNKKSLVSFEYSDDSERMLISSIDGKAISSQTKSSMSRQVILQHFLPLIPTYLITAEGERKVNFSEEINKTNDVKITREVSLLTNRLRRSFSNMEFIGAMRVPPSRTYLFTGEKRNRVGASGEFASSIIVMDSSRSGRRKRNLLRLVSEWLNKAGIAEKLNITPISDRHYELRVTHPVSKENQNITDVGFGNSQVIPVLVGGYNLDSASTYFVEEPEIHLHPKAQSELGEFFFDLYTQNIQSIVETHSEYLILRLQQLVADKKISPNDIVFYYVQSNEGGGKRVIQLELDELGRFTEELPNGFFPERLEEAKRLSQIRFKHLQPK